MKLKHIIKITGAALCAVALTACTTTTTVTTGTNGVTVTNVTSTLDIAKTTNAINILVPIAVNLAVTHAPQTRQYFTDVSVAINLFAASSTNYDPAALNSAITNAVGADAITPDALAAIDAVVALYKAYYGDAVAAKLNTPPWMLPVLQSLANAISTGLMQVPKTSALPGYQADGLVRYTALPGGYAWITEGTSQNADSARAVTK